MTALNGLMILEDEPEDVTHCEVETLISSTQTMSTNGLSVVGPVTDLSWQDLLNKSVSYSRSLNRKCIVNVWDYF